MNENIDLRSVHPDQIFDGGDLDCGSGLILLIRENMLKVPEKGVLEMRSREPTVKDDLPPWCRMVGHTFLGSLEGDGFVRYFVRRGTDAGEEEKKLSDDKSKAREYEWRARARSTGHLKSTVYCRNFSIEIGQPASFEESDKFPSAVEYLLSALAGDLTTGFATECSKAGLEVDDIEMTIKGKLENVLSHMGMEEGDPSFSSIDLKCFVSSFEDEKKVREVWERTVERSPIARTLMKAIEIRIKLALV